MASLVSKVIISLVVLAALCHASPMQHESRNKRDLMIEMDGDDSLGDALFGGEEFGDEERLSRKRRDLMIESSEGSEDNAEDFDRWLLENFGDKATSYIDELPTGKRSVSAYASQQYQQNKKSGSHHGKKKVSPVYLWFPDDTKHIRRPTAARNSQRVNQKGQQSQQQPHWSQQQFRLSDTFKFAQ